MNEVNPYQFQAGGADVAHQIMVVDPDNGDEQITYYVADDYGP